MKGERGNPREKECALSVRKYIPESVWNQRSERAWFRF